MIVAYFHILCVYVISHLMSESLANIKSGIFFLGFHSTDCILLDVLHTFYFPVLVKSLPELLLFLNKNRFVNTVVLYENFYILQCL